MTLPLDGQRQEVTLAPGVGARAGLGAALGLGAATGAAATTGGALVPVAGGATGVTPAVDPVAVPVVTADDGEEAPPDGVSDPDALLPP